MADRTPVVIDTDPGIDDALALLLAARWERCDVKAVSASYGNTTIDYAVRNAKIALARGGKPDVMVLAGADRPSHRPLIVAKETHGPEGLGDLTAAPPEPVHASRSALRDALRAAGGPVTLITLGPLTNLAYALKLDPDLVKARVTSHVMMGGSIAARGTATPLAEFNIWCDPEAAAAVFAAGIGTRMVGMDVTRMLMLPGTAVGKLSSREDAEAQWLSQLLGFYVRFHHQYEQLHGAIINDPLAVTLALEPEWGAGEILPVRVDLGEGDARGRTTVGGVGDPELFVYRSIDQSKVHQLLLDLLFGRWLTAADFRP